MQADTLTLKALFQKDVRYEIPVFQRPYVWNQGDQWEPLWEDVRNTAERYIDNLAEVADRAEAERLTGTHFMGAVVLQQVPTPSADLDTRAVIDGQQRLTTTQLLMDAAQEVFEQLDASGEAKRMQRLVLNAFADGDHAFKLWPTKLDQDAFRAAMTNGADNQPFQQSLITQAHEFFQLQILEWIEASIDQEQRESRIHGLESALFGLLEVVVIDLATADDAFVIFETLNARGTPLLPSDLVKNFVLQKTSSEGGDPDVLYLEHWKHFEDDWWRKEIRQGRIVRPRLDVFLNHWLIAATASDVPVNEVFPKFKDWVDDDGKVVADVVRNMKRVGETYRGFEDVDPSTVFGTFLYRWNVIDAGTTTPLLLWLCSQDESRLSADERDRSLRALESFLIRRMVCRLTTKGYNRLFLDLLGELHAAGPGEVASTCEAFLASSTAESMRWPNDVEFEDAFVALPLYRLLTRGRLRLVLEAIEDNLRTSMSEEANVQRGSLTIEHVLPQSWREHWPLPEVEDVVATIERDRILHTVGNLTLVNSKLNPKLSNAAWAQKSSTLGEHTVLHLNKQLLSEYSEGAWNEEAIRARGRILAAEAITVWPGAATN